MQTQCADIVMPVWIESGRDVRSYLGLLPVADLAVLCRKLCCNVAEVEERFCHFCGVEYNASMS